MSATIITWPLSQDYNEAIQSPATSFADDDLRRGQAVVNALGIPLPCSGNFADVYQVCTPDGARWAVKCFTRAVPGRRERYQEIGKHLQRAKLPFTVDFTYLEQGIRVGGNWFPILKMEWVEGLTLNQFVGRAADKPATLEALLQIWVRMARHLRASGAAHGDLQHGNVLLVPDAGNNSLTLKLVDYDGVFVPSLAGKLPGEIGHPSFQHPQRVKDQTYSLDVDRFPVLLVATALAALKVKGRALWEKYDNGDNLLFTREDMEAPSKSRLFYELLKSDDSTVRGLAENLIEAARKPMDQTPLLEDLLAVNKPAPVTTAPEPVPPVRAAVATVEAEPEPAEPLGTVYSEEPGRRNNSALWIAAGSGLGLLALMIIVIALAAHHGSGDTAKDQQFARGDSTPGSRKVPPRVNGSGESRRGPSHWQDDGPTDTRTEPRVKLIPGEEPDDPPKTPTKPPTGSEGEKPKPLPPLPKEFKNEVGIEFVLVPTGKSWLGGGGGKPGNKEFEIKHDFYLGKYLLTQEEWQAVMGANPSCFSRTGLCKDAVKDIPDADLKRFPMENVSWGDARAFVAELNKRVTELGWEYRLPTEAEWEYACRGGPLADKQDSGFDWYFDKPTNDLLSEQANFGGEKGLKRTCKVGSYKPNRLGLYDMHGNLHEWCDDAATNADGALFRVYRGGCWGNESKDCQAASRGLSAGTGPSADSRGMHVGLRVARVPVIEGSK